MYFVRYMAILHLQVCTQDAVNAPYGDLLASESTLGPGRTVNSGFGQRKGKDGDVDCAQQ